MASGQNRSVPRRRDLAWQSTETNQFGTNEFVDFCRKINAQPMLGVNMGTGSIQSAADLVEYCNTPSGTYWSDLRASHGYKAAHNVHYWCVGNEMDGPWQIGHLDAVSYGNKALEAAKMMKWQDPSIQTILCGSSSDSMPTYPEWDRIALEIAWEHVDYHSMHYYAGNRDNDTASYLASAVAFERFVDTLEGTLRYVKAKTAAAMMSIFLGTSGRCGIRAIRCKAIGLKRRISQRKCTISKMHGRRSVAECLPAQERRA
jgi:alpha-L-arabinofuranosidase